MNGKMSNWALGLAAVLVAVSWAPDATAKERFSLVAGVPDDVFFCVAGRHNTEREFLSDYWGEVFDALEKSGIGSDIMELIGPSLGDEQLAEVERLKERALQLIDGVDWDKLGDGEMVFAERFAAPIRVGDTIAMGPPDMVWMVRGDKEAAAENYDGLVAILRGILGEINRAIDGDGPSLKMTERGGAKIAAVNMFETVPQAPPLSLAVALHNDVILITLGDKILNESLDLLSDAGSKKSLAASSRFKQAFSSLPEAEDEMSFFDMQVLQVMIRDLVDIAVSEATSTVEDKLTNAHISDEADKAAAVGVAAYEQGDYKLALSKTQEAHKIAPTDSRIMYNLACFHALVGDSDDALSWLEKAVAGGFHSPKLISKDSDLRLVRADLRFKAALEKATKHAAGDGQSKEWASSVKRLADRIVSVPGMIDYSAAVSYTDGYSVHTEAIIALVPGASENPFYPIFAKAKPLTNFDRYLPEESVAFTVSAGIDLGELYKFVVDSVKELGPKGTELLAKWDKMQEEMGVNVSKDVLGWIQGDFIHVTMKQPLGQGTVLMLKVHDEEAAREKLAIALDFIAGNLKNLAQQNPMLGMLALRSAPTTHEKLAGFHNVTVGMMPQPAVCGVKDGFLFLGSTAEAVVLCLDTAAGDHPSVRANSELMAEAVVPEGSFKSVSYSDQRNLGTELAQVVGVLSMAGGMASMMIPDPEAKKVLMKVLGTVSKLGPVAQKINFYKSTAESSTFDGKVWRTHGVTNYRSPAERNAATQIAVPSEG